MRSPRMLLGVVFSIMLSTLVWAHVSSKTETGVNRYWSDPIIEIQMTGPTIVDGWAIHEGVRDAMNTWNAAEHSFINFTEVGSPLPGSPVIGNNINEIGWTESSDSPYSSAQAICTTVCDYNVITGDNYECDTTCNAYAYRWPYHMFGLASGSEDADAETTILHELGHWLGLDHSLDYNDIMYPSSGAGYVQHYLASTELAFARHRYANGTSTNGSISGSVEKSDGTLVKYAYLQAINRETGRDYGSVSRADGTSTIPEVPDGSYRLFISGMSHPLLRS